MAERRIRCAVYTRKSSEEGLEQEFNSLAAQREACLAYVASQRGEGWRPVDTIYDDGGFSGGNVDRPALKRLLADIEAGRIDVVLVYKVDRLTRALADFAKLVEIFDRRGVSFVSVTQAFNTTTSMGRLTLNVLLSFAQFEREVTGERIRDKIAASRAKGLWMGGVVPLGYDVVDKRLVVNAAEAAAVRIIFGRYAELGCVRRLQAALEAEGIRSKLRSGRRAGGRPLARGALYALLKNRTYLGEAVHKGKAYPGMHDPIVDADLFARVQQTLQGNRVTRRRRGRAPSLLAGLLFDAAGVRMSPSHAVKDGRRYRYYVSQSLLRPQSGADAAGERLPAQELEGAAAQAVLELLGDAPRLMDAVRSIHPQADVAGLIAGARRFLEAWPDKASPEQHEVLRALLRKAVWRGDALEIALSPQALIAVLRGEPAPAPGAVLDVADALTLAAPVRLTRDRAGVRLVLGGGPMPPGPAPNPVLVKALVRAQAWWTRLCSGEVRSIRELAREEQLSERYVARLLPLAFLAPDLVEAVLDGRHPADVTLEAVHDDLPLAWSEQRRRLGIAPSDRQQRRTPRQLAPGSSSDRTVSNFAMK